MVNPGAPSLHPSWPIAHCENASLGPSRSCLSESMLSPLRLCLKDPGTLAHWCLLMFHEDTDKVMCTQGQHLPTTPFIYLAPEKVHQLLSLRTPLCRLLFFYLFLKCWRLLGPLQLAELCGMAEFLGLSTRETFHSQLETFTTKAMSITIIMIWRLKSSY